MSLRKVLPILIATSVVGAACGGNGSPELVPLEVAVEVPTATVGDPAPEPTDPTPAPTPAEEPEPEGSQDQAAITGQLAPNAVVQPIEILGHDTTSFTQGLVFDGPRLYESRGQYGESALTEIDPLTGDVLRRTDLGDAYFAEGLALLGDRLFQITWREEVAFVYDVETFDLVDQLPYEGEGWGLCHDGADFWMSDGSDVLTRRDSISFESIETVRVTLNDAPVGLLNELECLDGFVWANVWQSDEIVVIDPTTGDVFSQINASGLVQGGQAGRTVLNGIAYDQTRDTMVITGKLWPAMFEVELVAS